MIAHFPQTSLLSSMPQLATSGMNGSMFPRIMDLKMHLWPLCDRVPGLALDALLSRTGHI